MTGRYDDVPRIRVRRRDGADEVLIARRLIPAVSDSLPTGTARVRPGDRLDSIAATALGDPESWWRMADANPVLDPAELEEPGRLLRLGTGLRLPGEVP